MTEKKIFALGFFDGVHLGHGALLRACRELADTMGVRAGAVTFTSHPDTLVLGKTPALINTVEDRLYLMQQCYGIDNVTALPFDRAMMAMPWQDFFRLLLTEHHAAGLVCGHDFRFGKGGEGTPQLLQQACREAGIPCVVVPEQKLNGITISSTHIRKLLEDGQMEEAVRFLGHGHILSGTVVPGQQLGRTIGVPTANLVPAEGVLCPKQGVYACRAVIDGKEHPAVTNVGSRPTVGGSGITIEPWVLDFEGDLYGKSITLAFYKYLRPEQKFASLEELRTQIAADAAQTLEFFKKT